MPSVPTSVSFPWSPSASTHRIVPGETWGICKGSPELLCLRGRAEAARAACVWETGHSLAGEEGREHSGKGRL